MSEFIFEQCSSLEKIFLTSSSINGGYTNANALKGEEFSYQIAFRLASGEKTELTIDINSPIKDIITLYLVGNVPSVLPAYPDNHDDDYITTQPGLFPDVLYPVKDGKIEAYGNAYQALWVSVKTSEKTPAGSYPIELIFSDNEKNIVKQMKFNLEIIDAVLPEQKLIFTQWFHADCISEFYNTKTFGNKHWNLIDKFMKMASEHGVNMILTPVFTPPLDTEVGGERPTVQLVDVIKNGDNYSFGFDKLIKWITLAKKNNIKYFEISHFFTQWGALATPKVVADVGGTQEKIFGWETKSTSDEYIHFLSQFIPELIKILKQENIEKYTYFHISDEPHLEDLTSYTNAKKAIGHMLKGFKIIDALSDYDFYKTGAVEHPIPGIDAINPFLESNIPDLWTYNCCAQCNDNISNRFMAMPSYRNRIIGCQLYKYNIKGFLHWGYNFYYTRYSKKKINPFLVTDAGCGFPSGDSFSVYPDTDGPIPSVRLKVFNEALQDMRAMELLETYISKDEVEKLIGDSITFTSYPKNPEYILKLRKKINNLIKSHQ